MKSHFMWGWQHHFRSSLDVASKYALRAIGAGVDPTAVLVGFRANDEARFDYCIEPEDEPIGQTDLTQVLARARAIFEADEDSEMFHTDPGVHESRQRYLRNRAQGQALCEALSNSDGGEGRTYFASQPRRIANYDVYAVVGVVTHRWERLDALQTRSRDHFDVTVSLPEAVIAELLSLANHAMALREPPQSIAWESSSDTADIVRAAAHRFVTAVAGLSGQWLGSQLYEHIDAVAAQPYEGRTGVGTIVLATNSQDSIREDVHLEVAFKHPVRISETRAFRKVLEMSGDNLHVMCDGEMVYGLGRVRNSYNSATERVFHMTVVGRGSWELSHDDSPLLTVNNTRPQLPRPRLSPEQFGDTVQRLFPEAGPDDIEALWTLAQTAADQEHGTMLVVHRAASGEAERLAPQALAIDPVHLTDEQLRAITNIDGAVLVSPDALCHAVGVILDGQATGDGDPARGARYNSAVRYRKAAGNDCLVIIVSEDGMIDLLPNLKPRVDRERVERAVQALEEASQGDIKFERFYRRREHVEALEFYLDEDQCARANSATDRVEDHRESRSLMRVYPGEFTADPEMDDSYFL
ncbi:diadenylate cyclase [Nocardioides sp. SOB77]|uniref:Diadenylate cyclase n=1 Tax=Nocardioides oceani TaxID=3058369 RepID=A0ABT8FMI1_9ACTN|nr:diadenylate cyclase [Nocardioides oceani]MDN4175844.1 diadenylate cyclase [Nocardioides oceani]